MTPSEIISLLAVAASIYGVVAYRRNRSSDAYLALINALKTSGQTIDDLMNMVADMPRMRRELEELRREREEWQIGIGILLAQLVKRGIEPEWKPRGVKVD